MKKYIKDYSQINESIGRGSVVLIKGKSEGGKKKLYAAHVLGTAEISHGATMLFLSDDFYRIKEEDGNLRALKIGYRSEESLKSVLNLKSPGKISIVKNNNKTPFHWKTTKHTHINSALKDVEHELLKDSYIFESDDSHQIETFDSMGNYLTPKILRSIFFETNEIIFFDKNYTDQLENAESQESTHVKLEWEMEFRVFDRSPKILNYLETLELDQPLDILISINSEFSISHDYDPGDYYTPPYHDTEITNIKNEIIGIYIEGSDFQYDDYVKEIISKVNNKISEYGDGDFREIIKKINIPKYLDNDE